MKTQIKVLPAGHGDCLIIETFDDNNSPFIILIDGGTPDTFKHCLKSELKKYSKIDLIILTHIDDDHIGGVVNLISSDMGKSIIIDKIIINAANLSSLKSNNKISYLKAYTLEKKLAEKYNTITIITDISYSLPYQLNLPKGIDIKVLSPHWLNLHYLYQKWKHEDLLPLTTGLKLSATLSKSKDYNIDLSTLSKENDEEEPIGKDIFNASSLAFTLKTPDLHSLFLGDAHPEIVIRALTREFSSFPIQFDYIKLSHHGSKYNISNNLLDHVQSNKFIISTNGGGGRSKHPDRQTIAKIVCHHLRHRDITFYLNYSLEHIENKIGLLFQPNEEIQHNFKVEHKNILQ